MDIYSWFEGLATIGGFLYFLTGFGTAYLIHFIRCKMHHKGVQIEWRVAGIAIGVVAIVITSFQAQIGYSTARQTASEVRDCQHEFNGNLVLSRAITTENDDLSLEERGLLVKQNSIQNQMWLELVNPPPDMAALDTTDHARQSYGLKVVVDALNKAQVIDERIKQIEDRQAFLVQYRKDHPLPDPTCGK